MKREASFGQEAAEGHGATTAAVAAVAGLAGLAVGAGAVTAMKLGKEKSDSGAETEKD